MERVAPRQIMYENQLPLAIESKSQRRLFYPEGASTYGPQGNAQGFSNIIRIPINADSLLDAQHSYLQFDIKNTTGNTAGYDFGVPVIRRLRIESAGTTLEDINNYNKLYGSVLLPAQGSVGAIKGANLSEMGMVSAAGTTALSAVDAQTIVVPSTTAVNDNATAINPVASTEILAQINATKDAIVASVHTDLADVKTKVDAGLAALKVKLDARTATNSGFLGAHEAANAHANNSTLKVNVPLVSGLLNMEKYLPLVMMNAGLVLELELGPADDLGVKAGGSLNYEISNVRYVAHLIDLQRDFYDKLRMVMEGSGGVLQLTGSTFRNFSQNEPAAASTDYTINIPARVKSIKSIFFTMNQSGDDTHYNVGSAQPNGLTSYQFRVGSVLYPPHKVQAGATNKGEPYMELRKAFGTLGDYQHGGVLLDGTSYYTAADKALATAGQAPVLTPFALDFESFPKTALENGINSADRSLPITLEIERNGGPNAASDVEVWVMCDAVFYVNLDGSVSVSI